MDIDRLIETEKIHLGDRAAAVRVNVRHVYDRSAWNEVSLGKSVTRYADL